MSDLQKAAQQALDALEQDNPSGRTATINALRAALLDEGKQEPPQEPNMRHPKIQALIGANARLRIELSLVEQLLDDPNMETTASDMEYWDTLHDRLYAALTAAPPQRPLLTDEEIDRATAQDRDALLDHIYEYGTAAEGVLERVRKLCRTIECKVRGEEG